MVKTVSNPIKKVTINQIEKMGKKVYFFNSSKEQVVKSIRVLREKIQKEWDQTSTKKSEKKKGETYEKLENEALRLATATKEFKSHCWFGNTSVEKTRKDIDAWAGGLSLRCAMMNEQKTRASQYVAEEKELEDLKKRINDVIPAIRKERDALSLAELIQHENELKSLLKEIPEDDKQTEALWWDQNKKLKASIQKKRINCGTTANPLETVDFTNNIHATSIFNLVNLGSWNALPTTETHLLIKDAFLTLSFFIKLMEGMLVRNEVPKIHKKKFITLLKGYKAGFRLKSLQDRLFPNDATEMTIPQARSAKKQFKTELTKELKNLDQVTISTGYATYQGSQEVALTLKMRDDEKGVRWVKGEVVNRGEGIAEHGWSAALQSTRVRFNPYLQLAEVPLNVFKKSEFLDILPELKMTNFPKASFTFHRPSEYTIKDFYDVLITMWPSEVFSKQDPNREVRGLQRGGTGCFKVYLTPFRDLFLSKFARICKLKMRIEALELYLLRTQLNPQSIKFLKGTLFRIHRSLKKLDSSTDAVKKKMYPGFEDELYGLKKYCRLLSQEVHRTIVTIKNNNIVAAAPPVNLDFNSPTTAGISYLNGKENENFRASKKTDEEEIFPFPPKKFNNHQEIFDYLNKLTRKFSFYKIKSVSAQAIQFLDALPSCKDSEFWTLPELFAKPSLVNIQWHTQGIKIEDIRTLLAEVLPATGSQLLMTGRKLATKINVLVGILISLKASNKFDPLYIRDKGARMLGILEQTLPQIRTGFPEYDRKINEAIKTLKKLTNQYSIPFTLKKDGHYYVIESHPCKTIEEVRRDVVSNHRYNELLKSQGEELTIKNALESYPNSEDPLEKILLHIEETLIYDCLSIHRYSKKNDYTSELQSWHRIEKDNSKERNPIKRVVQLYDSPLFSEKHNYPNFLLSPAVFFGTMVDQLFPWSSEEHQIARQLLDNRLELSKEPRKTQNQHIRICRNAIKFGGVELKRIEFERFLSIIMNPDTLIPQIIHCFSKENSFIRLLEPRFQAILHGYLLSKNASGTKSILVENFEKGGITVAGTLVDFFVDRIKDANLNGWREIHLFLVYLLAQTITHFPESLGEKFIADAQQELHDAILLYNYEKETNRHKNLYNHWIIAIYPFIENYPDSSNMKAICQQAYIDLNKNYYRYNFHDRLLILETFKLGKEAFSHIKTVSANKIPDWVFQDELYERLVHEPEPIVGSLDDYVYQIETKDKQQLFRLKVDVTKRDFRIQKRFGRDFYLYISTKHCHQLPALLKTTDCWVNENDVDDIFFILPSTKNIVARMKSQEIVHPSRSELIHISDHANIPFIKHLLRLGTHPLIWKKRNTNQICLIEFPLRNLTFELSTDLKGNTIWVCPQHNHMKVNFQAKIRQLDHVDRYVVLEGNHKKIALVANAIANNEPNLPAFFPKTYEKTEGTTVFALDIKNGKVDLPRQAGPFLYFIHTALSFNNYPKALALIKKLENLGVMWSEEDKKLIDLWKGSSTDASIYASVLRLRLLMCAYQATPVFTNDLNHYFSIADDYKICLDHLSLIKRWWLSPSNELILNQLLNSQIYDFKFKILFSLRQTQLEALLYSNTSLTQALHLLIKPAPQLKINPGLADYFSFAKSYSTWSLTQNLFNLLAPRIFSDKTKISPHIHIPSKQIMNVETLTKMLEHAKNPLKLGFIMRAGDSFVYNFFYYYRIAYELKPERELIKLKNLLQITRLDSNDLVKTLHALLLNVILIAEKSNSISNYQTSSKPLSSLKFVFNQRISKLNILHPDELIRLAKLEIEYLKKHPSFDHLSEADQRRLILVREESLGTELKSLCKYINSEPGTYDLHQKQREEWDLSSRLGGKKMTHSSLKEKSHVIEFNQLPPVVLTTQPPLEAIPEVDFTAIALAKNFIILQSKEAQKEGILTEITHLKNLYNAYLAGGEKSRLMEGILEKIKELETSLENPVYLLPIAADLKELRDFKLNPKELWKKTELWLERNIKKSSEKSLALQQEIEEFANRRTLKTVSDVYAEMGNSKNLKINDILIHLACNEENRILEANTELQGSRYQQLRKLVHAYLVETTDLQHYKRCRFAIDKVNKTVEAEKSDWSTKASQHAAANFVSTLLQKRAYQAEKDLRVLVYEALNDIRLHQEQYDALQKLNQKGNFELEARTGFGKTKVLVPLWLLLNSKPGKLVTFTTTASLLKDQEIYLKEVFGDAFDKRFEVIDFSIEKITDIPYLVWLNGRLKDAVVNGGKVFLLKIDSLHGITGLGLKDQIFKHAAGEIPPSVFLLSSIRSKFKRGRHFVDESAECFKIRYTFDYANGEETPIKFEHCLEALHFFRNVVFNPQILEKWRFEFISDAQYKTINKSGTVPAQLVTEQNYEEGFLPDLVKTTVEYLKIPKEEQDTVFSYLMGNETRKAAEYFETLSDKNKDRYAYCFHQLHTHLKITLLKKCGERYDIGKQRLATPLDGGSPKEKSEFATIDDLVNFTIQANVKRLINSEIVDEFVKEIQTYVYQNGLANSSEHPKLALYAKIKKLKYNAFPKRIRELNQDGDHAHTNLILNIFHNPKYINLRLEFIAIQILPLIRSFPQKISGNSFTLIESLGEVNAASGTVNSQTLPPGMQTIAKKSAPVGNLLELWRNPSHDILQIAEKNGAEFLEELLTKNTQHRTLIDAGGILRDLTPEAIVKLIFTHTEHWKEPKVSGVLFYDNNRVCRIWPRGHNTTSILQEHSDLPIEEIYVFIRQSHAIGSDVPMPKDRIGLCTFGKETQEKFFLQAIGRMRGLTTGQTIYPVVTEEDAQVIATQLNLEDGEKISLKHLLIQAQKQEIKQNRKDYYFALKQYIINCIEREVWDAFECQKISLPELSKCFHGLKPLLMELTEKNPRNGLFTDVTEVEASVAVDLLKNNVLKILTALIKKDGLFGLLRKVIQIKRIEANFQEFLKYEYLEKEILVGETSTDEMTCEVESEKMQEKQKEVEVDVEKELALTAARNFIPATPAPWNGDYETLLQSSGEMILDIKIVKSPNLPILHHGPSIYYKKKNVDNKVLKPAYEYVLQIDEEGYPSLLALDLHDMSCALKWMRTKKVRKGQVKKNSYYLIANNRVIACEGPKKRLSFKSVLKDRELRGKVGVITRILSGSASFSKMERLWMLKQYNKERKKSRLSLLELLNKTHLAWPEQEALKSFFLTSKK